MRIRLKLKDRDDAITLEVNKGLVVLSIIEYILRRS